MSLLYLASQLDNSRKMAATTNYYETAGSWVLAQRNSYQLKVNSGNISFSIDTGATFPTVAPFVNTALISWAYMFDSGAYLFGTEDNKIYNGNVLSTTITERIMLDTDDNPYVLHTPVNPTYPGRYFVPFDYTQKVYDNNTEVFLWGNYGNVDHGACAANLYYTVDDGATVKVAYKFGLNTRIRDDGTLTGGATGNLIGDASNPIMAKHTHSTSFCKTNGKYYFITGDHQATDLENHWFEGTYNWNTDVWTWNQLTIPSPMTYHRMKGTGLNFVGINVYWGMDWNHAIPDLERGVWRCNINDISDPTKHEQIIYFDNTLFVSTMYVDEQSGMILGLCGDATVTNSSTTLLIASNFGQNWEVKTYPGYRFQGAQFENNDRYYRIDTDWMNTQQTKTAFIRPGLNLWQ